MDNLLSGLEAFGLKDLEQEQVFSEPEQTKEDQPKQPEKKTAPEVKEEDLLFDKTYVCPICEKKVMARTIRTGKLRLVSTDIDLRPKYEPIESLKYDVVSCQTCGFTSLARYFGPMAPSQKKAIMAKICSNFVPKDEKIVYSYEDALERYKLALANAIVKGAKASEKAFICLKAGWLLRSQIESLDQSMPDYEAKKEELSQLENSFLKNAKDGFVDARMKEAFPMCGMNEPTVDYLLAALSVRFADYNTAAKLIAAVITSGVATSRLKDKARDLKDMVVAEMKKK